MKETLFEILLMGAVAFTFSLIAYDGGHHRGCVDYVHKEFIYEYHAQGVNNIPKDTDKMLVEASEKVCRANEEVKFTRDR
jgi:hypothetical protein